MAQVLVKALLALATIAAGLRILTSLVRGLTNTSSVGVALLAFLGVPLLLWAAVDLLRRSKPNRTIRIPLALLTGSVIAGVVGLVSFVLSRFDGASLVDAHAQAQPLLRTAGLGLCATALTWGLALAADVLERPPHDDD